MGVRLGELPRFIEKWAPGKLQLVDGWQTRSRSSGDFDQIQGIGVHHAADSIGTSVAGTIQWATVTSSSRPIGNGTITRTRYGPRIVLWSVRATNTQGKGGPVLTNRGVIPLDSGNRRMFSWEAMNNGSGEPWDDAMCDLYVRACCAVLDCINSTTPGAKLTPGDIFAHFEWAPTRKNDPAGPCRWNDQRNARWDMNRFRGDVFMRLMTGPVDRPTPPPAPPTEEFLMALSDAEQQELLYRVRRLNARDDVRLFDANDGAYLHAQLAELLTDIRNRLHVLPGVHNGRTDVAGATRVLDDGDGAWLQERVGAVLADLDAKVDELHKVVKGP
jgi:hypothetical protein